MDQTPQSLLDRLRKSGEPDAWGRFVALYTPILFGWARRLGLGPDDAADLVQEVFVTLLERLPEFLYDPNRRFRGWLWTVTLNKYRERRRRAAALAAGDRRGAVPDEGPDPTDGFDRAEYNRTLAARALRLMEADFRPETWRAFWEHSVDGRPAQEVAAGLGTTPGAVYAATARVLGRLRDELRDLLD
ncbi:MAG: sigma-70 family RNA polymerase sigma factor [Gemmataceae bacterium]|nr:sigma-70 family RNA polymerase sigma factor [Gemmataceae bacterium]